MKLRYFAGALALVLIASTPSPAQDAKPKISDPKLREAGLPHDAGLSPGGWRVETHSPAFRPAGECSDAKTGRKEMTPTPPNLAVGQSNWARARSSIRIGEADTPRRLAR